MTANVEMYDPVAAYDRIAPKFRRLAEDRMRYLDRVDEIVASNIPSGSRSLLDIGAGDGRRALRIAQVRDLNEVVLVEPSREMQRQSPMPAAFLTLRVEQLHSLHGSFDVIVCLWNVLGHVLPHAARVKAMRQFGRLVSPRGRIFVDVNHRYNAARYGACRTAFRFLRDRMCGIGCGLQTVKDHLKHAYEKFGVHQRSAVMAKVLETGPLDSDAHPGSDKVKAAAEA